MGNSQLASNKTLVCFVCGVKAMQSNFHWFKKNICGFTGKEIAIKCVYSVMQIWQHGKKLTWNKNNANMCLVQTKAFYVYMYHSTAHLFIARYIVNMQDFQSSIKQKNSIAYCLLQWLQQVIYPYNQFTLSWQLYAS